MSILDKLTQRQQSRQQSTAEQYRALLERLSTSTGEPSDKDVELLDTLVSQLRFNAAQVDEDIATIRNLKELQAIAAKVDERRSVFEDVAKKLQSQMNHTKTESEKLKAEELRISGVRSAAHAAWQASLGAATEIDKILGKSPHLKQ